MTRIRAATHTVACIDDYCAHYRSVFHNVRHFEQFTQLELGMLAETKRKSLPRLAKTVQGDHQALHHFLANADWSMEERRTIGLRLTWEAVAGRPFVLCIDETGDRKQGHSTDYAASQYLGGLHRVEQGMVSVNAYGVVDHVTFPLALALYKPKTRLKPGDRCQARPFPDPATAGPRIPLRGGPGRHRLGRQLTLYQRSAPPGAALCGGDPLHPWRLDGR
jgi:SRSO17 transposase